MRFECIFDENDWIVDNETGEYMGIEEACQKLNDYEESMGAIGSFLVDFNNMLNKARTEEER